MRICIKKDKFEKLLNMALQNCNESNESNDIFFTTNNPVPDAYLTTKILNWFPIFYLYIIPLPNVTLKIKSIQYGQNYTIDMVGSDIPGQNAVNFAQVKGGFLFGTYSYFGDTIDVTLTAENNSSGISEDVRIIYYSDGTFLQGTTVTSNNLFNGYLKKHCDAGCHTTSSAGVALIDTTYS